MPHPSMPELPASSPSSDRPDDIVRDALRYWEPRRLGYNFALSALACGWVVVTWPHFRPAMNMYGLIRVLILAALANVPYCAAYLVDLPLQQSSLRDGWRKRRWLLWLAGTLFAMLFEYYWIGDEIYPFVN